MNQSLTEAVMKYKETGDNWSLISEPIYEYVYHFPRKWTSWDGDRCSDFFISFVPRIPGIIERYNPDYCFEIYLNSSLRWFMKTFTEYLAAQEFYLSWAQAHCRRMMEELEEDDPEQFGNFLHHSEEVQNIFNSPVDKKGRLEDPVLRRRLIFAILLNVEHIDIGDIDKMARFTGVEKDWLEEMLGKARQKILKKRDSRNRMEERRNECWYFMQAAGKRLESDEERKRKSVKKWRKKAQTWYNRYLLATRLLKKMKVVLYHYEIAEILDLPAGTVASGLYFLRKIETHVLEKDDTLPVESVHGTSIGEQQGVI